MSEADNATARPTDPVGRVLYGLARGFAIFGGIVLCAMALLTTVSVTGRSLTNIVPYAQPILGDFELIEIGTGVGVFLFLPYCQLMRENVIVDFFLEKAPFRLKAGCDAVGNLMYGFMIALLTWRTTLGGVDMYNVDEMTLILEVPRWWTFPLAVLCLFLLLCVCLYTLVRSVNETRLNRTL